MGPVEDSASIVYLRPETAQGIFVNFKNVQTTARQKMPFGIAQIGKSFRNEITPGNFLFRTREFEQMEMEFFVKPGEDDRWFTYWTAGAPRVVRALRHPAREPAPAPARGRRAGALRQGVRRRRVQLPDRLVGARGHRQPDRLRSAPPCRVQRQGPALLRRGGARALSSPTSSSRPPAPTAPRSPSSSMPTTKTSPTASRARCCACIRRWRRPRPPSFRCCARTASRRRRATVYDLLRQHVSVDVRSGGRHRPSLSAPGRGRHAVRHHHRSSDHGRTTRSHCATVTAWSRSACRSIGWWPS